MLQRQPIIYFALSLSLFHFFFSLSLALARSRPAMVSPIVSAISFFLSLAMIFLQCYLFSIPKRLIFESVSEKNSPRSDYYSSPNTDYWEREESLAGSTSNDSHDSSKKMRSFAIVPGHPAARSFTSPRSRQSRTSYCSRTSLQERSGIRTPSRICRSR